MNEGQAGSRSQRGAGQKGYPNKFRVSAMITVAHPNIRAGIRGASDRSSTRGSRTPVARIAKGMMAARIKVSTEDPESRLNLLSKP